MFPEGRGQEGADIQMGSQVNDTVKSTVHAPSS